jgi:hypothetical protein
VEGLLEQGRSGEEDGLDRRRCRLTPNVASSTTTGVETMGALMDVVLSVDGALVRRIGLTKCSSGATTSGQDEDGPDCGLAALLSIDPAPLPNGLVLLPSGLGGMLVALKMGQRL